MALHGFERAAATTGARARLIEGEGQWTLVVVDSTGRTHRVQVAAPVSPADREDTLALAARLLAPTTALALPDLPPVVPQPRQRPLPQTPPEPKDTLSLRVQTRPQVVLPKVQLQPSAAVAEGPTLFPPPQRLASARIGTSFVQRPDMELSAGLSADASWGSPTLQLGLAGLWAAPNRLPLVDGVRAGEASVMGGLWYLPKVGASLGVHVGFSRRNWSLDDTLVLQQSLPSGRLMLGWRLPLGRVSLEPAAELRVDFARTELQIGDRALGSLAPWQAGLSVAFRAQTDPFASPDALPQ
ncbi:MAG: hypothetical protein ACI9VR_003708 [Cognaticolwellia sp.]|jgi:hypothetical protein